MRLSILNITCLLLLLIGSVSRADVTIEVLEAKEGKFLVTYEIYSDTPRSTGQTISGLSSIEEPPEVLSVTEKNSKKKLQYDVLPMRDKSGVFKGQYRIRAKYDNPIPQGEHYILEYRIILYNKENCYEDQEGRWVFRYETSHSQVFFTLPKEHAIVNSNFPALIYEEEGRTIVQAKIYSEVPRYITKGGKLIPNKAYKDTKRTLVYKTRAFAR